jgi:tRNA A-37 threonylcarbamoyl transferase component Bud32
MFDVIGGILKAISQWEELVTQMSEGYEEKFEQETELRRLLHSSTTAKRQRHASMIYS